MFKLRFQGICLILLLMSFTSCKVWHNQLRASKEFHGINQYAMKDKNDSNNSTRDPDLEKVVKILLIHGIGTKSPAYSRPMIDGLVKELGLVRSKRNLKSRSFFVPYAQNNGSVTVEEYYKKQNRFGKEADLLMRFQFFSVHWSPVTQPYKIQIKFDDEDERRKLIPDRLKYAVITDGLADVALYYGNENLQKAIQKPVWGAFFLMLLDDPYSVSDGEWESFFTNNDTLISDSSLLVYDENLTYCKASNVDRLFLISGSFGSKVSLDAIQKIQKGFEHREETPEEEVLNLVRNFCDLNFSIYMISNQIPLFNALSNSSLADEEVSNKDIMSRLFLDSFQTDSFSSIELNVFNDPNDILGFRISPALFDDPKIDVTNISLKNTSINPLGLRLGKAHSNAMRNRRIHESIVYGLSAKMNKATGKYKRTLFSGMVKGNRPGTRIEHY